MIIEDIFNQKIEFDCDGYLLKVEHDRSPDLACFPVIGRPSWPKTNFLTDRFSDRSRNFVVKLEDAYGGFQTVFQSEELEDAFDVFWRSMGQNAFLIAENFAVWMPIESLFHVFFFEVKDVPLFVDAYHEDMALLHEEIEEGKLSREEKDYFAEGIRRYDRFLKPRSEK